MPNPPFDWNERYATKDTPWDSGEPSREMIRVLEERKIKPCRTLEVGCGTGTNAIELARRGFDVTAFDLSPLAIEQARAKAKRAGVNISFMVADALNPPDLGRPLDLIFDRGVYHSLRPDGLLGFLKLLERFTHPGSVYVALTGNANDPNPDESKGPPRVQAHDLCKELHPLFDLVQLREFHFDGVVAGGEPLRPLGWSALLRRR
jgi:SAM-dependent methyltransferase